MKLTVASIDNLLRDLKWKLLYIVKFLNLGGLSTVGFKIPYRYSLNNGREL